MSASEKTTHRDGIKSFKLCTILAYSYRKKYVLFSLSCYSVRMVACVSSFCNYSIVPVILHFSLILMVFSLIYNALQISFWLPTSAIYMKRIVPLKNHSGTYQISVHELFLPRTGCQEAHRILYHPSEAFGYFILIHQFHLRIPIWPPAVVNRLAFLQTIYAAGIRRGASGLSRKGLLRPRDLARREMCRFE